MSYLLLTILANTAMIFVMRHSETHSGNRYAVTVFNYVTGVLTSFLLMQNKQLLPTAPGSGFALGLALFNALCMLSCMLLVQMSILKNGAPISTTFNRLGILIPTILSIFLFREIPDGFQVAGILLAALAIVYLGRGDKGSARLGSLACLILVFLIGGLIDFNSKLYSSFGRPELQEYFVFWTFLFALVMSVILLVVKNRSITRRDLVCGVLVGIPNQLVTFCLVKASALLPAYLVFPAYSAAVILGVNAINFLVFRERPTRRELAGTLAIAIALVLINL